MAKQKNNIVDSLVDSLVRGIDKELVAKFNKANIPITKASIVVDKNINNLSSFNEISPAGTWVQDTNGKRILEKWTGTTTNLPDEKEELEEDLKNSNKKINELEEEVTKLNRPKHKGIIRISGDVFKSLFNTKYPFRLYFKEKEVEILSFRINNDCNTIDILVSSPDIEEVQEGECLPVVNVAVRTFTYDRVDGTYYEDTSIINNETLIQKKPKKSIKESDDVRKHLRKRGILE